MQALDDLRVLQQRPHEYFRQLAAARGRVARFGRGKLGFSLLSHPDDVQHVLVGHPDNFDKHTFQYRLLAEITGAGLLTMDGPEWLWRRRVEQPSFHRDRIEDFVPFMHHSAGRLVSRLERHAGSDVPVDVSAEMLHVALDIVVRALFGVEVGSQAEQISRATMTVLHAIMHRARTLRMVPRWLPTSRRREFARSLAVLDQLIYATIERRRASEQSVDPDTGVPDLLARLMTADVEEKLDAQALRDEMLTMIIAGHETVASSLTWVWHLLAGAPEVDHRLAEEARQALDASVPTVQDLMQLELHGRVFAEALRLYPPAWIISRRAKRADVVDGVRIPAGGLVVLSPYVTQRDDSWWPAPDRFDPDRFEREAVRERPRFAYFPFGGGGHQCIGNHFAMVEAAVIMSSVIQRFRLESVPGHKVEVDPGVTLAPKGGLPMLVRHRKH
jgi:cytochrome P450